MRVILLFCLAVPTWTHACSTCPRMTFAPEDAMFKSVTLPRHHHHLQLVSDAQTDTVIAAGQEHLYSVNFTHSRLQHTILPFNIAVLHRTRKHLLFLCGTSHSHQTTLCNLQGVTVKDVLPEHLEKIQSGVSSFKMNEGEPSVLIETEQGTHLYMTQSSSQFSAGVHKFGMNRVGPSNRGSSAEQQYVALVPSQGRESALQDKLYIFYKERKRNPGLDGPMWVSYIVQTCLADRGGPKTALQYLWTSRLWARLFCGSASRQQRYSELQDVSVLQDTDWRRTRVYALFTNEWNMAAVCVYTVGDIENLFNSSDFQNQMKSHLVPRTCSVDSTDLGNSVLQAIDSHPEMNDPVVPHNPSSPLLVSHHHYTGLLVAAVQNYTLLFLSLQNGRVHKVLENNTEPFLIAEYRPFEKKTHITSMTLHPSARKLYLSSNTQIVQLDLDRCGHYGASCEDCVLSRDPQCGWKGSNCVPAAHDTLQSVGHGDHKRCQVMPNVNMVQSAQTGSRQEVGSSVVLQCPMKSYHADYSWYHHGNQVPCTPAGGQCLHLIDIAGPADEGSYSCVSQEMGFNRTLVNYHLQVHSGTAGLNSSLVFWSVLVLIWRALS